jgi:hypothetical protein
MLDSLRGKASERKLRLFAAACCRRVWHLLTDDRSREAVEVAERYADGHVNCDWLVAASDGARQVKKERARRSPLALMPAPSERAVNAAFDVTRDTGMSAATNTLCEAARAVSVRDTNDCDEGELREQAAFLRCIFSEPRRPVGVEPSHLTAAVVRLAQTIYEQREFQCMHELADALEYAGCTDAEILDHCRGPGPHARGCWVLDLDRTRGGRGFREPVESAWVRFLSMGLHKKLERESMGSTGMEGHGPGVVARRGFSAVTLDLAHARCSAATGISRALPFVRVQSASDARSLS